MDRNQYHQIRNKLNLEHRSSALFIHMLQNLFLIGAIYFIATSYKNSWAQYLAIPLISAFIFRGFSMMHEAVHFAASKNRWLNDVTGIIAGSIALLPYEPWKRSHLEHHKWSGNVEKDPVMAIINFFPTLSKASRNAFSFFWKVWFPMLACMQYSVFWMLAAKQYVEKPMSAKLLISLLAPVIMWTSLIALLPTTFSLQILLPAVLIYFVAVEVVNFPHHLQLPQYRGETKLAIWDQHKIARSCVYPKWFGRLVALNFNYHIEHHMFPDVPWYHLEALHKEVSASLQADYNTDPYFQWILENKVLPIEEVLRASNHTSQKEVA